MAKLDRLGWTDGISFVAYGRRVGIRVNASRMLERIARCLPPGWKPSSDPLVERLYSFVAGGAGTSSRVRRFHLLYSGASRIARTLDLEDLQQALTTDLQLYVAEMARRRLFVHAGVVEWGGEAIVIPGRSYSGKSSLVAALVRAGATYYSDEYAVFSERGTVCPFRIPLTMRTGSPENGKVRSLEQACKTLEAKPAPVGLVVLTNYRPGVKWHPKMLSPGSALLGILAYTVAARTRPRAALRVLSKVVSQTPVLRGERGEADEMACQLLDCMSQSQFSRHGIRPGFQGQKG